MYSRECTRRAYWRSHPRDRKPYFEMIDSGVLQRIELPGKEPVHSLFATVCDGAFVQFVSRVYFLDLRILFLETCLEFLPLLGKFFKFCAKKIWDLRIFRNFGS